MADIDSPSTPVRPQRTNIQTPAGQTSATLSDYSLDIHTTYMKLGLHRRTSSADSLELTILKGEEEKTFEKCENLKRKASTLAEAKYEKAPADLASLLAYARAGKELMEAQLDLFQCQLATCKKKVEEGSMTQEDFGVLKEKIAQANHVIRKEKYSCEMALKTDFTLQETTVLELMSKLRRVGEAYALALATQHKEIDSTPEWLQRDSSYQIGFRKDLELIYGCRRNASSTKLWCPVLQKYLNPSDIVAAHLVPHLLGYDQAGHIFNDKGNGFKHIWSRRNGLLLYKPIEKAFDRAKCVIIPSQTQQGEFELRLLDSSMREDILYESDDGSIIHWADVDGRQLDFRDAPCRPRKRYLYAHYIFALFRTRKQDLPTWATTIDKANKPIPQPFASPGKYWGDITLRSLARIWTRDADNARMFEAPDHPDAWNIDDADLEALTNEALVKSDMEAESIKNDQTLAREDHERNLETDIELDNFFNP